MPSFQILSVTALGISREGTTIIDNISWAVGKGEHWVILGANGSGKTSLLSALTGYLTPTTGEVEVFGQRYGASDWRELRRAIGIVSSSVRQMMHDEEPALDSVISGKFAMIDFWGKSTVRDRAAALRILRQVECGHLAARAWRVLSQGERQRVLIGRALMARAASPHPGRALRGAGSRFAGAFSPIHPAPWEPAQLPGAHPRDTSRRGYHAASSSHVLMLKGGRVLASGARGKASSCPACWPKLSGRKVTLRRVAGRYQLSIHSSGRAVC